MDGWIDTMAAPCICHSTHHCSFLSSAPGAFNLFLEVVQILQVVDLVAVLLQQRAPERRLHTPSASSVLHALACDAARRHDKNKDAHCKLVLHTRQPRTHHTLAGKATVKARLRAHVVPDGNKVRSRQMTRRTCTSSISSTRMVRISGILTCSASSADVRSSCRACRVLCPQSSCRQLPWVTGTVTETRGSPPFAALRAPAGETRGETREGPCRHTHADLGEREGNVMDVFEVDAAVLGHIKGLDDRIQFASLE